MGRSPYQSEKRRKELARLKKQEEKRQRRFNKKNEGDKAADQTEGMSADGSVPPPPATEGETGSPQDAQSPTPDKEEGQTS